MINEKDMERIEIFGKYRLGEEGFCLNASKITGRENEFKKNLDKIVYQTAYAGARDSLVMISMTNAEDIAEQNSIYIPTVVTLTKTNSGTFDPYYEIDMRMDGKTISTADFIVWDRKLMNRAGDEIRVATYSRTAPILYFETAKGKCCLGTVLRPALMTYGEYIISKILRELEYSADTAETGEDDIAIRLVTCTGYKYPEGTIYDNLKEILDKFEITNFEQMYVVEEHPYWLYQKDDFGNHVVVVGGKR